MGAYTWLSDYEFEQYSSVTDKGINEALQEVRSVMPEWYICETFYRTRRNWGLGKEKTEYNYTVYHRTISNNSGVRTQLSATTRDEILNLLYGLYMGYHKAKEDESK